MPEGGSSIFTDADGFQAVIQDILDLVVLQPRDFDARLTWADLPKLQLLRAKESSARVGFMRLPPNQVFVTFTTNPDSALLYSDTPLKFGDLMWHSRGETPAPADKCNLMRSPFDDYIQTAVTSMAAKKMHERLRPRPVAGRRRFKNEANVASRLMFCSICRPHRLISGVGISVETDRPARSIALRGERVGWSVFNRRPCS